MVASAAFNTTVDCRPPNLIIDAEELLEAREKITKLYFKQKVIIAPCLSKLYFYCEKTKLTDSNQEILATATTNWHFSTTGLITVIYDDVLNEVKLALFKRHSLDLHWYLKWTDFVSCEMATANFQVINTERDNLQQYVGIDYYNKDVAELIANTVSLFYSSIKLSNNEKYDAGGHQFEGMRYKLNSKTKLRATQSDALLKMNKKHSSLDDEPKEDSKHEFRRSSLRGSLSRKFCKKSNDLFSKKEEKERSISVLGTRNEFSGLVAKRAIERVFKERRNSDSSVDSVNDEECTSRFSRADHFRRNRSHSLDTGIPTSNSDSKISTNNKGKFERQKSLGENNSKENMIKQIFNKKRRISRTQSLTGSNSKQQETKKSPSDYQRPERITKPRSLTDPIILNDDSKLLFESAYAARDGRERKKYMRNLSEEKTPTTNLCDTDV